MNPLQGALVGFGAVAQNAHAAALRGRADLEIVAVADLGPERLARAAEAFPGVRTYPNLEELLAAETALDFVDLATPPWLHGRQALLALERGLHVLCEKPLCLVPAEFRRLSETARRQDRAVFTVHNWAYAPIWAKAAELAAAGLLGDIRHAQLHAVRTKPSAAAGPGDWRVDAGLAGGGILVDHGWHNLYLLRRMLCARGEAPAAAEACAFFHRPTPTATETEATVFYRFPSATALLHLTWRGAARSNWALFHGTQASLELRDDHLLLKPSAGPEQRFDFPDKLSAGSAHPEWLAAMLPDFCAEMRDSSARGRNLAEAGFAMTLIRQAYDSVRPARRRKIRAAEPAAP
ncbi:MAG: Gfo/Idh/MocA family oxidoreductase [Elusimicrobia bacterium]|nr:Gfo/Idh/MocA family oxidoreductase [Elusimicrobiota bacterium]